MLRKVADGWIFIGTGTFARVWLARFKADERKDRVYALKILRKADGEDVPSSHENTVG